MATIKLKHVETFKDRYGKRRFYFRQGKGKRIALDGLPGSTAFNDSYATAISKAKTQARSQDRTFNALATAYFASAGFVKNKDVTKTNDRNIINLFLANHGHRLVYQMTREHVDMILAAKVETPSAANSLLKRLRRLMKHAVRLKWIKRDDDPTIDFEMFKEGTHHTWTDDEVKLFRDWWKLGTRERTAFELHLMTGQRRADIAAMKWSQLEDKGVRVVQQKTGKLLLIPIHPDLKKALAAWPRKSEYIICTKGGKPYTVDSYGNLLADAIADASLPPRCVLHGIRKAAARRLAEAGCTPWQVMAVMGWKKLAEAELYTAAANQVLLAGQAMASLG